MPRPKSTAPGIYAIRCILNDKAYVGSAIDIGTRRREHRNALDEGRHCNQRLQRAWKKHGPAKFVFEVLESVPRPTELLIAEQSWIDRLRSADPRCGYNICPEAGSSRGRKLSATHKARISASQKGRPADPRSVAGSVAYHTGRPLSKNHKEKLSLAGRGKRHTAESKARMSEARKKIPRRPPTTETRAKMSESHKARTPHPNSLAALASADKCRGWTDERRAQASARMKGNRLHAGHRHSDEALTKMSAAHKARPPHPNSLAALARGRIGRKVSDATRARISEAKRGRPRRKAANEQAFFPSLDKAAVEAFGEAAKLNEGI